MIKKGILVIFVILMLILAYSIGIFPSVFNPITSGACVLIACLSWYILKPPNPDIVMKVLFSSAMVIVVLIPIDIMLRPLADEKTFYRFHERFAKLHDLYPQLLRYHANVDHQGSEYGDLAALSGRDSLREIRTVRFQTDKYGFRNSPEQPTNKAYTLLLFGDSFGVGHGIDQDGTWAAIMNTQHGYDAYNLSQPGGMSQHVLNYQIELARLQLATNVTCVLIVFSGNDLDDHYEKQLDISKLPVNSLFKTYVQKWRSLKKRSSIQRLISMTSLRQHSSKLTVVTFDKSPKIAFLSHYLVAAGRTPTEVRSHPNYPMFMSSIDAFRELCRSNRHHLVIGYMPTKAEVYPWIVQNEIMHTTPYAPSGMQPLLMEYCSDQNIPFCDFGPSLNSKARELWRTPNPQLVWWRDDTHLNDIGHTVVAETLNEFLTKKAGVSTGHFDAIFLPDTVAD